MFFLHIHVPTICIHEHGCFALQNLRLNWTVADWTGKRFFIILFYLFIYSGLTLWCLGGRCVWFQRGLRGVRSFKLDWIFSPTALRITHPQHFECMINISSTQCHFRLEAHAAGPYMYKYICVCILCFCAWQLPKQPLPPPSMYIVITWL